jgi:hypothetical protein
VKYQGKTPLNDQCTLKNIKNRIVKQVLSGGGYQWGRESEGGQIWWLCFVYLYENRTMKTVEIVLGRGERMKENDGGGESN